MRSLLLNRWVLLCLAIFALVLAPFWRNLRDGIPDLLVGAMAGPAELATLALNEDDPIQDALLVPEHQSTGSVMDLQVLARRPQRQSRRVGRHRHRRRTRHRSGRQRRRCQGVGRRDSHLLR